MNPGRKQWRRLTLAAWAVCAVSFILPAYAEGDRGPSSAEDSERIYVAGDAEPGWEAFLNALLFGEWAGKVSALTNLFMLVSLATLRTKWTGHWLVGGRWLPLALGGAGILNLAYWPIWVADVDMVAALLAGYWAWAASFLAVALGLWMQGQERKTV